MYLKELLIDGDIGNIRTIHFHKGLNLIVDVSIPLDDVGEEKRSGNNIGKTTVLKLINFCMGADRKEIYTDPENDKNVDYITKNFLENHKVVITLILKEDLSEQASSEIKIERNFLLRKQKISKINGKNFINDTDFKLQLKDLLFPDLKNESRPTFSQLIANNIRYKDIRINNTINNLDTNTKPMEYEALYLYMLGCPTDLGEKKLMLQAEIKQEKAFLRKLEQYQTKNGYTYALSSVKREIEEIEKKKNSLNINEEYEKDLDRLDEIKSEMGAISNIITNLSTRLSLVEKSIENISKDRLDINEETLKNLYEEAKVYLGEMQKEYEDLVKYHEVMLSERKNLLEKEQLILNNQINHAKNELDSLIKNEKIYAERVRKCATLKDLEKLSQQSNDLYRLVGEYETAIKQITESENKMKDFQKEINNLESSVFSKEFQQRVHECVEEFDRYFTKYSKLLYNESFHLKEEIKVTRENQKYYKFDPYSMATSTGKKQGETLSFDMAYIEYAQHKGIYHLDFLLNDKKELMDVKQIISIANILKTGNMQLVISILQDKLPESLNHQDYIILKLSQENKLFRIEEIQKTYDLKEDRLQ